MLLSAAAETGGSDARFVALLIGLGIAVALTFAREWWQARKIQNPSPPPPMGRGHDEDPQAGDGVTDDDTSGDTGDDTVNDFGLQRIRLADGSILKRRVLAVLKTGSSQLPEDEEPAAEVEDEGAEEVNGETRAEFADRLVAVPIKYSAAVADLMDHYGVSESTAKRDLAAAAKRARAEG